MFWIPIRFEVSHGLQATFGAHFERWNHLQPQTKEVSQVSSMETDSKHVNSCTFSSLCFYECLAHRKYSIKLSPKYMFGLLWVIKGTEHFTKSLAIALGSLFLKKQKQKTVSASEMIGAPWTDIFPLKSYPPINLKSYRLPNGLIPSPKALTCLLPCYSSLFL